MKIIFLDIDGVLNNQVDSFDDGTQKRLDTICDFYSPRCVNELNKILDKTRAKIVVSSTWRIGETLETISQKLFDMGVAGEVVGVTPILNGHTVRGNEIEAWIKNNSDLLGVPYYDFKSYIILDDDSDMLYPQRDNFIQVDPYTGITPRIVFKAINKLN